MQDMTNDIPMGLFLILYLAAINGIIYNIDSCILINEWEGLCSQI
jgi:hypothetical protein